MTRARGRVPDVLAPDLDVLFVGINPGLVSARRRHHFANPGNGFWRLLHEAGFTPRRLAPEEDGLLLRFRLGITNLVARESAGVADLTREELLAGAGRLGRRLRRWRPRAVVFVGITVWSAFARRWKLPSGGACGEQPQPFAGARLFVLPNPSGRNAHFSRARMRALYRHAARSLLRPRPPLRASGRAPRPPAGGSPSPRTRGKARPPRPCAPARSATGREPARSLP